MKNIFIFFFLSFSLIAVSQTQNDSLKSKQLKEIVIKSWMRKDINRLPPEENGYLNAGKKTELITISGTNANIAIKTGRQLFSKVPGVFVYDMDGSGNQINISTRGLDAHRSWEFNIRQNGIIINSDMYGYPASHYSAPMESFEKIEILRGTGALQFGAQFGGMINYVTKRPDSLKLFSLESVNTAGSYGLLSSYTAVGGTIKKFSYYAYYYHRHSNGYRKNSSSDAQAQFIQLGYRINNHVELKAELGRSEYLYQIPGPLNDSMFHSDPTYSTRNRNYFNPDIYIPSLQLNWKLSERTRLNLKASGVFGFRNSVQFDAFADVSDNVDPATNNYKNRQVDMDGFNSRTAELKVLHNYRVGKVQSVLVSGLTYLNNDLHRRQLGKGTTGSDYDLTLVVPGFGRDLHFRTSNLAFFTENLFHLNKRWSVSPGFRIEKGDSKMNGVIQYYAVNDLPTTIKHHFALVGVNSEFMLDMENSLYGGISTAYRPVIFKDIIPASTYEQIDKNLKDAMGYNLEAGVRGKLLNHLQYDFSFFSLVYKNRMGTVVNQNSMGANYTFKTNIGNSRTSGIEVFLQYKFPLTDQIYAGLYTSTSFMDAKYVNGFVSTGSVNKSIKGNRVESVPEWISRNGLDILYKGFSCTILYSYTGSSFSDALNTITPPPSGAKGLTPAYSIWDFNASLRTNAFFIFRAGVSNIFNKQYYTKRPVFYPGPGIWPSDGRNGYLTIAIKI